MEAYAIEMATKLFETKCCSFIEQVGILEEKQDPMISELADAKIMRTSTGTCISCQTSSKESILVQQLVELKENLNYALQKNENMSGKLLTSRLHCVSLAGGRNLSVCIPTILTPTIH